MSRGQGGARRLLLDLTLGLALGLLLSGARAETGPVETAARNYYQLILGSASFGLPEPALRKKLEGVLSRDLLTLLDQAARMEQQCIRAAAKDEKPSVLEGNIFVGNYEGATEVAYGQKREMGHEASMEVDLVYLDTRYPRAHPYRTLVWHERLRLGRQEGQWRVVDVDFAEQNSLRKMLLSYLEEGRRDCALPATPVPAAPATGKAAPAARNR